MGSVLGSCLGSFAASCGCAALNSCGKGTDPRIPYLVIVFLMILTSAILLYWGGPINVHLYYWDIGCTTDKCYGDGAVYRIMFATFLFYTFFAICMKLQSCAKSGLDKGYWIIKILMLIALLVIAYMVPNEVITGYKDVSIGVSAIYLVIQIVLLIDFAYNWNEAWLEKEMKVAMLVVSLIGYILSLVACVLLFMYYTNSDSDECHNNKTFISLTILITILFTFLSASDWCEHGAILPSSCVTFYSYWILYSALSDSAAPCNSLVTDQDDIPTIIGGFVMLAASVVYSGWSMSGKINNEDVRLLAEDPEDNTLHGSGGDDDEEEPSTGIYSSSGFHMTMAAASCYATVLLTNWGDSQNEHLQTSKDTTMWIKMGSQWTCMVLYTWSLMAPYVLSGFRSFD